MHLEPGMMILSLDKGMGGWVQAIIGRFIPTIHTHDTQCHPSSTANGHTFSMASSMMGDQWDLPDTPDIHHHPTSTEHMENLGWWFWSRPGITHPGSQGCLRLDDGRRAGMPCCAFSVRIFCGQASPPSCSWADTTIPYSTFGFNDACYESFGLDDYACYIYQRWCHPNEPYWEC